MTRESDASDSAADIGAARRVTVGGRRVIDVALRSDREAAVGVIGASRVGRRMRRFWEAKPGGDERQAAHEMQGGRVQVSGDVEQR
jgi:hypothetical protein